MGIPTSTTTITTSPPPPTTTAHVVVFPYMAQGHTLPLIDISKALASHGLRVTIITTPLNAPFIHSKISSSSSSSSSSTNTLISLSVIPFPKVKELPQGCENTAHLPSMQLLLPFVKATKLLQQPFEDILQDMIFIATDHIAGCPPICVISDFFLGWTLDSCRKFGNIPRIVFHGMGALPMVIIKALTLHAPTMLGGLPYSQVIELSTVCSSSSIPFPIIKADMPFPAREGDPDNEFFKVITELEEAGTNSWGVLVNSFEQLEGYKNIAALESLYQEDARAWCVGPLFLLDDDQINEKSKKKRSCSHIKWLDQQVEPNKVLYISFGSEAQLSNTQMDQIAFGLEMAGQPFIWKIKSSTWVPPNGWEERVVEMGLVERDWVDQRGILAHPAVGGFLSHCGWNSVLESLSMGVPLLTWPMAADQPLNAKYVAMGLRAGIMIPRECDEEGKIMTVDRGVICAKVEELMRGDEGRNARERAQQLGRMARAAVEKGGSSHKKLCQLIECLTLKPKQSKVV